MNNMITVTAKTVEEAITKAAIQLGVSSDKLTYSVIEKGSSGLLGFLGSKPAVIKAGIKDEKDLELVNENAGIKTAVKSAENQISKPEEHNETGKRVKTYAPVEEIEEKSVTFLKQMFAAMGMEIEVETSFDDEEKELSINMTGDNMGIIIGKRGQTLDSLQYLVSLIVNKCSEGYIRVKLDTENYRERRKETLETLAKNIAYKVKRTKHSVALEPMNPYERRIIHSSLQDDKYVTTRSDGEEPFRHVVITLKKDNNKKY